MKTTLEDLFSLKPRGNLEHLKLEFLLLLLLATPHTYFTGHALAKKLAVKERQRIKTILNASLFPFSPLFSASLRTSGGREGRRRSGDLSCDYAAATTATGDYGLRLSSLMAQLEHTKCVC